MIIRATKIVLLTHRNRKKKAKKRVINLILRFRKMMGSLLIIRTSSSINNLEVIKA